MCEAHHLQNNQVCVAFVSGQEHITLVVFLNLCLHVKLLQVQQQVEPLRVVHPVQRSVQVPKEIPPSDMKNGMKLSETISIKKPSKTSNLNTLTFFSAKIKLSVTINVKKNAHIVNHKMNPATVIRLEEPVCCY